MLEETQVIASRPRRLRRRPPPQRIKVASWDPRRFKELGHGGEAIVYRMNDGLVAKVFHKPNAIEYRESPELQEAARIRIEEMQTKLFEFPPGLPKGFTTPTGVLQTTNGRIFGYVMSYVAGTSLGELNQTSSPLTPDQIHGLITRLHDLVSASHACGVVIGDFNENNVIVTESVERVPYLIDTDSAQFGRYQCRSFMPQFTAPEILELKRPKTKSKKKSTDGSDPPTFSMVSPHNELTDWYSFLVIVMRMITYTDPLGGVVEGMDFGERFCKWVTIFDPTVVYPQIARPLKEVPRSIVELFFRAFQLGERFVPEKGAFDAVKELRPMAKVEEINPKEKKRRKKNAQTNG